MTQRVFVLTAAVLCLLSPASADVTGNAQLILGRTLDLDTGAIGTSSSADLIYTGQNGVLATLGNGTLMTILGAGNFAAVTQAQLAAVAGYVPAQIFDQTLRPGIILAAKTKAGRYSKILVANNLFGNLFLVFQTFTGNSSTPTIVSVQNNFSQLAGNLPNSGLAPGALFSITGTGLSTVDDGQRLRSSSAPGLQTTAGGVTVTVTVNGIAVNCLLYYLSPTQINAVLPGGTPVGRGTIVVTNEQLRSAAFDVTVTPSAFGIVNYNGTLAATYDANNALISRLNAVNPGQTIVIWGSGVGSDPGNDDRLFPQKTNNLVNVPMQVLVGGRQATILYRGRSQFPGVDQIVATLPANVPTGCYVPLTVVTGNVVSNGVTIPVAASGKTCADPGDPLTPALIQTLSEKGRVRVGSLVVQRIFDVDTGSFFSRAFGRFRTSTGFSPAAGSESVSIGNCITYTGYGYSGPEMPQPLDAGTALNVAGPQSSLILNRRVDSAYTNYEANAPQAFVPAAGGTFVIDNSSGGVDVQRFSTTVSLPSNFTWTNAGDLAVVNRQGTTVTWSGGAAAGYVWVVGGMERGLDRDAVFFSCRAPASAGQFTIPPWALMAIPSGSGSLGVYAVSSQQSFTAPGLDYGDMLGYLGFSRTVRY